MKKFIIKVTTNWCGMDQEYAAIAEDEKDLDDTAAELAYNNFADFDLLKEVTAELFPDVDDEEFTDDQVDAAIEVEGEYYSYTIEEFDENTHGQWEWYDLKYDANDEII